jgi:hypothetical protein
MRKLNKYNLNSREVSKSIFKYKNDEFSDNVILKKIEFKDRLPTISSNISLNTFDANKNINKKQEKATAQTDIYEEIYLSEDENSENGSNKSRTKEDIVNHSFSIEDNKKEIHTQLPHITKIYSNSSNSSDDEKYDRDQTKLNDFIKNKKNYRDEEPEISKFYLDYNNDDSNKNFRSLKSNSISLANRTELENKNRNRSKSIFSTKSINKKHEDESEKRRNIIDIIRKFNGHDDGHLDQPNISNSNFLTSAVTNELTESNNNYNEDYNDYYSDNKSSSNEK